MSKRLKDLRTAIQSVPEADKEFENIARLDCELTRMDAAFEAEVSALKARHETQRNGLASMRDDAVKRLAAFVETNPQKFQCPRRRKTLFGSYGLQTATKVQVVDRDAAIEFCIENKWTECIKTSLTLLSSAVQKRLAAGELCAGATLISGDVAGYTVKKELLDEAKGKKAL